MRWAFTASLLEKKSLKRKKNKGRGVHCSPENTAVLLPFLNEERTTASRIQAGDVHWYV
jgi:hypothetical protein